MIVAKINANAAVILRGLQAFPPAMGSAIARGMDHENELTVGHIQSRKLSRRGPMTLGVVTNRLRSSARPTKAAAVGNTVSSAIGSNVIYAKAHEFGFSGNVQVREHVMRNAALDVFSVRGQAVRGWELTGTGAKRAKRVASGVSRVKSHRRLMNIPARAPFRTGIEERAPQYSARISEEIVHAWNGGRP